jgi:hypothetical protein
MAFFQCGSVRLLVGVPPESTPYQRGSTVYFQVSDIQSAHTELSEDRTLERPWLAEFADPDGNVP